jgi:hypothetical protein
LVNPLITGAQHNKQKKADIKHGIQRVDETAIEKEEGKINDSTA